MASARISALVVPVVGPDQQYNRAGACVNRDSRDHAGAARIAQLYVPACAPGACLPSVPAGPAPRAPPPTREDHSPGKTIASAVLDIVLICLHLLLFRSRLCRLSAPLLPGPSALLGLLSR